MRLINLNKWFVVGVILFLSGSGFMLLGQYPSAAYPVYNQTDDVCYQTIQSAINNASTGDVIKLYSTTFYENITIDVSITLEGHDLYSTHIQGDCTDDVITITAPGVTIKGLCVSGCGDNSTIYHGIKIESNNNTIEYTLIAECHRSIFISGTTGNNIKNNMISTTSDYYEGITDSGSYNKIYKNQFFRSVTPDTESLAIVLLGTSNTEIYQNTIINHRYAVYMVVASNNSIIANTFQNNDNGMYLFSSCANNKIHHNNFLNNVTQAYTYYTGANQWDNGCPSGGNYWDDNLNLTDVVDCDAAIPPGSPDGICDNSLTVPGTGGTTNYDYYPLTAQWSLLCGNVDGSPDYAINMADLNYLIASIYSGGPAPVPPCVGDFNCSGTLTMSDITLLISYLNSSTPLTCCCQ